MERLLKVGLQGGEWNLGYSFGMKNGDRFRSHISHLNSVISRLVDGELVARHYRHGEIRLTPIERDVFTGDTYFFRPVRFERDASGALGDMFVGEGRARNLRFVRAGR